MDDALAEIEWVRALWHEVMNPATNVLDGSRLGDQQSVLVLRQPNEDDETVRSIRISDTDSKAHVTDAKSSLRRSSPKKRQRWTRSACSDQCSSDFHFCEGPRNHSILGARYQ